jgi:outer membrane biosynthesis protein TonB
MLLIHVSDEITTPEWIEIAWGRLGSSTHPASASAKPGSTGGAITTAESTSPIQLPERVVQREIEKPLTTPKTEKASTAELKRPDKPSDELSLVGEKERGTGSGAGEKEDVPGSGPGPKPGDIDDVRAQGEGGDDIGRDVSFSVEWAGGGTRRLLVGGLPEYPEGVNVEVQIKIRAVVQPSGFVKALQPMQKGETRLENAAMEKMRLWRFEPLSYSQPQLDQVCVVTFNFRLE